MDSIDVSKYSHSPVHLAIILKDYAGLRKIIAGLPKLCKASEIETESVSIAEEAKADAIASVIDRRDVPNRETPLHIAVRIGDETAAEMLMLAGVNFTLQNEQGYRAIQEAICNKQESIARIIFKNYRPVAWAKWRRRLPHLVGTMRRMRDFYMEITFHFESSVIPFIGRIAPSDTYKIWKRGANLRVDMTLAGFDGFKIKRSDQSVMFLGDGSEDGRFPPLSLCTIKHKEKEIMNALDGAGLIPSDEAVRREVSNMSRTNIFRPGIDVTEAILLPQMTWRRQEKTEMVGSWKTKVYDMHNVVVSIKSRKVPGAMSDEERLKLSNENKTKSDELDGILTADEKKQLEIALKLDTSDFNDESSDGVIPHRHSCDQRDIPIEDVNGYRKRKNKHEKKGWLSGWSKRESKADSAKQNLPPRSSMSVGDLIVDSPARGHTKPSSHSVDIASKREHHRKVRETKGLTSTSSDNSDSENCQKDENYENEYKKGLRPILWLSPKFPLKIEELLPLLDTLANKVKAIRRLRELLATKLPKGSFPVKVAIPVVPSIKVIVTFTKFEELQPLDEFNTPPTSPTSATTESQALVEQPSSSWLQWMKPPFQSHASSSSGGSSYMIDSDQDPFAIPADYTWMTTEAKIKKMQEKYKLKKEKNQK